MPIEFTCPNCQSLLRVEDSNAGKRARCPHCGTINPIPGEQIPAPGDPVPPPSSHQFFLETVSGQSYGPVKKSELDQWAAEGRMTADCRIRPTGHATSQPASTYYPTLAPNVTVNGSEDQTPDERSRANLGLKNHPAVPSTQVANKAHPNASQAGSNPYQSPAASFRPNPSSSVSDEINPVQANLGEVFSTAYQVFTRNLGLLFGVAVVCFVFQFLSDRALDAVSEGRGPASVLVFTALFITLHLIRLFLGIGQIRIALKLVRGEHAEFSDLFSGGPRFLSVLGYSMLVIVPLFLGFLLLLIPGILMLLLFWPSYTLVVDNKTSVFESFDLAYQIGKKNVGNTFLLALASIAMIIFGTLLLCIPGLFAIAYVSVLWAVAYLMMTGQIQVRQ